MPKQYETCIVVYENTGSLWNFFTGNKGEKFFSALQSIGGDEYVRLAKSASLDVLLSDLMSEGWELVGQRLSVKEMTYVDAEELGRRHATGDSGPYMTFRRPIEDDEPEEIAEDDPKVISLGCLYHLKDEGMVTQEEYDRILGRIEARY